jgi:TonB family protein
MVSRLGNGIAGIVALILFALMQCAPAQANSRTFAFVNARYIITAEVASEHAFVVNFINLSDFVIVIQPNEFIYRGESGRFYIGQVYERGIKDAKGEPQKYSASVLLKGHSFTGLTIVGSFHEQDEIAELSVRVGAKRFYLLPMEKVAFEQLASKIGELDLSNPSAAAALAEANISEMGNVRSTDGTSEWDRDWQGLLTQDGVNPPKIIERPEISATPEARKARTSGKIRLSGIINKSGGIQDLKVIKGLGKGLDQRALDGIKNSWVFLPATKNGEVLETVIPLEVEFQASDQKQP